MGVELDVAAISESLGGRITVVQENSVYRLLYKDFLTLSTLMKLKMGIVDDTRVDVV